MSARAPARVGYGHYHKPPIEQLTERDRDWLERLSNGLEFCDIYHSRGYLKNRMMAIRRHLNANNTTQAIAIAIRRGIIR